MRELIRKIIRESSFTAAPQWFKDWEALPVEKRIESIEMRKKYIIKMIPKIMIVDDEDLIIKLLRTAINRVGYECIYAKGGDEAFKIYKNQHVSLIISDVCMPEGDGDRKSTRLNSSH